jgi:hypothetical protein
MPTVLRFKGLRFFFYSSDRLEPPHIHVERGSASAKIWLDPVSLASSNGFSGAALSRILNLVRKKRKLMLRSWNEFFRHAQ